MNKTPRQIYDEAAEKLRQARERKNKTEDDCDAAMEEYREADIAYFQSLQNPPRQ